MLDFALGELGLLPEQFWGLTWPDYGRMCRGYWIRRERDFDPFRHLMTQQYNLNRGKRSPKKPHQLFPLPFIDEMVQRRRVAPERSREFTEQDKAWFDWARKLLEERRPQNKDQPGRPVERPINEQQQ